MIHLTTPMLFALGFITMFTLGGISGIMLAVIPVVIHVSDTYFVVAHIHYVLFGGSVFTIFAGLYHWFPKMTGRMYDESLGKLHFWLSFVFFNLTFGPMHFVGVDGMPRRVADYAEDFATHQRDHLGLELHLRPVVPDLPLQHDHLVAARPEGGGQPVARPLDRVAGVLAAADLQLRRGARRWSAAPTSTASRARVHAVFKEKAPAPRRPPRPGGRRRRATPGADRMSDGTPRRHPRGRERDRRRPGADRRRQEARRRRAGRRCT